jgi:Ser/Thr protein kinase RdoA (MazF antagonist)
VSCDQPVTLHASYRPDETAGNSPLAWVAQACRTHGLNPTGLRLIAHYSNAVVLVPGENAVARVAIGHHNPQQIRRSLQATRWLDQHEFPTVTPLGDLDITEITTTVTVSFWRYYPQPTPRPAYSAADLGRLLSRLHQLPEPPITLEPFQPLTSLADALADDTAADVLTVDDRAWLQDQITAITERLTHHHWSLGTGLIHGDAWNGNLLHSPRGVALGDWDRVSHGPRELDLIPTWHATHRYGRTPDWTNQFIASYGYDLRDNPAYHDLLAMRDLAQLPGPLRRAPHSPPHAAALHQRLTDLREGNTTHHWIAL